MVDVLWKIGLIIIVLFTCNTLYAGNTNKAVILSAQYNIKVLNGDTIQISLPGFTGQRHIKIRLNGIITPDINIPDSCIKDWALRTQSFLQQELQDASKIVLRSLYQDRYGRYTATLIIDNRDIAMEMLQRGLAQKYDPDTIIIWRCNDL